ncbi:phospholipase D-like domain-containing protein [Pseudooceanicola nanhaiensis]|uniref:phospholipase D-like domain-containing protein n=1 Tax=Pseudooceanicola nanhaiensis TaxID=375761 RepID=UPI001CD67FEB|nr:phospholipase D family protein [Pseudooceanicola nanhaiensis]MCA0920490.1 phospholipase D family protein [Pseudooceanicola nanhaiensis]
MIGFRVSNGFGVCAGWLRGIGLGAVLCALSGCVTLDATVSRNEPQPLVEVPVLASSGAAPTRVVQLVEGNDALGARLSMIARARHRIDIQTFLVRPDMAGALVSLALIEAADRGVAVRLLVDDAMTTTRDSQLAFLSSHPRISVRVFNPLGVRSSKALSYMMDFPRVNRRMHNKTFIVDGRHAIMGGRNIADEYYQIDTSSEFADFDLFLTGGAVSGLSDVFERYWGDAWSLPVEAYARPARTDFKAVVAEVLARNAERGAGDVYRHAVESTYLQDVLSGRRALYPATAEVLADTPDKLRQKVRGGPRLLAEGLMQRIAAAQKQVTIITPYFVPEEWGVSLLEGLAARGVQVRVVTNSLAATNHPYVHGGYLPHRERLLKAGVSLYEVKPYLEGSEDRHLTMHTKLVLIDDSETFVGSMNFDPRSIKVNTEVGVLVHSPSLTRDMLAGLEDDIARLTYRLSLDAEGRVTWVAGSGATFRDEPHAGGFRKFVAHMAWLLPVEGQL